MDLKITISTVSGRVVLAPQGELDLYGVPNLREAIIDQVARGNHNLVIDMLAVDFMDDTGQSTLVDGLRRVRAKDGSLVLVCTDSRIIKRLQIAGLTKVFSIFPTVDAAVTARR